MDMHVPGPPELLPGRPDAVVDLQTAEGAALVGAEWRYSDARVEEIDFVAVGSTADPRTRRAAQPDVRHRAARASPDYDDSDWRVLSPDETQNRAVGPGRCASTGTGCP